MIRKHRPLALLFVSLALISTKATVASTVTRPDLPGAGNAHEASNSIQSADAIVRREATESTFNLQRSESTAYLVLSCRSGKTAVDVITGMAPQNYKYGPDGGVVTIQFDDQKAKRHHLLPSADEKAIRLEKSRWLLKELTRHDTMRLTFRSFNSRSAKVTFDLRGMMDQLKPLKVNCSF